MILAFGGIDDVVITVGLYVSPDANGGIPDERWADTFRVNVTGPFIVAQECEVGRAQNLPGNGDIAQSACEFYSHRTRTRQSITPADQAEAVFLLVSNRLRKTTGQIIHVDGGLLDAFLK